MTLEEKKKKLGLLSKSLEKKYSSKVIVKGSEIEPIEYYSTGIPSLDTILGGGWAKNVLVVYMVNSQVEKPLIYCRQSLIIRKLMNHLWLFMLTKKMH